MVFLQYLVNGTNGEGSFHLAASFSDAYCHYSARLLKSRRCATRGGVSVWK